MSARTPSADEHTPLGRERIVLGARFSAKHPKTTTTIDQHTHTPRHETRSPTYPTHAPTPTSTHPRPRHSNTAETTHIRIRISTRFCAYRLRVVLRGRLSFISRPSRRVPRNGRVACGRQQEQHPGRFVLKLFRQPCKKK